jgi:tripartite-type tricarboxylate transporter receptor subunit TctC
MDVAGFTAAVLEIPRSGRIRVLAVTSPKRLATAPEIPTVTEAGFPGLTVTLSLGLLAPSGTPTPIIEQIAQATRTALAEPTYQQSLIEGASNPPRFKFRKIPPVPCHRCCTLGGKSLELKYDNCDAL